MFELDQRKIQFWIFERESTITKTQCHVINYEKFNAGKSHRIYFVNKA